MVEEIFEKIKLIKDSEDKRSNASEDIPYLYFIKDKKYATQHRCLGVQQLLTGELKRWISKT